MAIAESPVPVVADAQRVVIACEFVGDLPESQHRSVCEQLRAKAQLLTELPVQLAASGDLNRTMLDLSRNPSQQLVLRVVGRASAVEDGRKTLALQITPVRLGQQAEMPLPLRASVDLTKVQDQWVVMGPVAPFAKLLGSGPRTPRAPMTADQD